MLSPAFLAWQYYGKPQPILEYPQKYIIDGRCSHCGHTGEAVLVKRVVSKFFTNWDLYSNDDKPLWCNVCIWSFTEPNNKSEALVFTGGIMRSGYQVQSMKDLLKAPLSESSFFSAALKKNKHVLPYAQWGKVRIEDMNLQWGEREVSWLNTIEHLISLGFLMGDIKKDESPTFSVIGKLNKSESAEAYLLWNELIALRKFPQLFTFILGLNKSSTMEYKTLTLNPKE